MILGCCWNSAPHYDMLDTTVSITFLGRTFNYEQMGNADTTDYRDPTIVYSTWNAVINIKSVCSRLTRHDIMHC